MQTFIKQYGEKRTGTNYLRALLATACPQTQVLMHILGDKHDAPPPSLLASEAGASPWELTVRHASATTRANDQLQESHTGELTPALMEALQRNEVLFCISVKNPFAWAYSMLKQHGAADTREVKPRRLALLETILVSDCHEFNRKYAAWQTLQQKKPRQTMTVRYENLLERPADTLADICGRLQLPFFPEKARPVENIVLPAHWDFSPPEMHHETFDGDFYRTGKYLERMHPTLVEVVEKETDWTLMADYGYRNILTYPI